MKKIIYIFVILLISINSFSQNSNKGVINGQGNQEYIIRYGYDNAGNRIQRRKVIIYSPNNKTVKQNTDTLIEQIADKIISIYPNPVTETLNIYIEEYESEIGIINLYSLEGRLITTKKITESNTKINFINKAPGSYIVKIIINNKTKEYTVVKNNK